MQVTDTHREQAALLVSGPEVEPPASYVTCPAAAAFLAAIERLSEDEPEPYTGTSTRAYTAGKDAYHDDWRLGYLLGRVSVEMSEAAEKPLSVSSPVLFLTPAEAERRGWELIALAHLARSGS